VRDLKFLNLIMKISIQNEKVEVIHERKNATVAKFLMDKSIDLLEITQKTEDWLILVGGVAMEACSTRKEQLSVALKKPDDYTFRIAFGKIVDLFALKKIKACVANPIALKRSNLSEIEIKVQIDVFDRAITLDRSAEETEAKNYESFTYLYSVEKITVLKQLLKNAKHYFLKAQLTSWLSTSQISAHNPNIYLFSN